MEDVQLEDYEDVFVSGAMFDELGVDMFNVKEMGIDMTSIPVDLWNKKAEKPIKSRLIRQPLRKGRFVPTLFLLFECLKG